MLGWDVLLALLSPAACIRYSLAATPISILAVSPRPHTSHIPRPCLCIIVTISATHRAGSSLLAGSKFHANNTAATADNLTAERSIRCLHYRH